MSKHTPGPWRCIDTSNSAHDYRLTKPDGTPLPLNIEANDHSEQRANARLISCSPEMLKVLEKLTKGTYSYNEELDEILADARRIIAKVRGEK